MFLSSVIVTFKSKISDSFLVCRTACMKLEEYQTAKKALEKGASIAPCESKFKKLIDECELRISGISPLNALLFVVIGLIMIMRSERFNFFAQKKRKFWFNRWHLHQ